MVALTIRPHWRMRGAIRWLILEGSYAPAHRRIPSQAGLPEERPAYSKSACSEASPFPDIDKSYPLAESIRTLPEKFSTHSKASRPHTASMWAAGKPTWFSPIDLLLHATLVISTLNAERHFY